MSGDGKEAHESGCICEACESQRVASACGGQDKVKDKVMDALYDKIDALTTAVSSLQNVVALQATRLENLDSRRESVQGG